MDMQTIRMTVGRLLCGHVRNYLNQQRFLDQDIDYLEGQGWIEREFIIKGNDLSRISRDIDKWSADHNLQYS